MRQDGGTRLQLKSYFANSVVDAMEKARAELGVDALLMNSREAPPEARHLGALEVVFGVGPASTQTAAEPPAQQADELRQLLRELRDLVSLAKADRARGPAGGYIETALYDAGIHRDLAREIEIAVEQRCQSRGVFQIGKPKAFFGQSITDLIRETVLELEGRFGVEPEIERISAFIGPSGSGKTTSLVKLALERGVMQKRPVRLISMDHIRIAAAEQLRTYAAVLGIPLTAVETPCGLAEAISAAPSQSLILIDTFGVPSAGNDAATGLTAFLRDRQDIDTHLVLTAGMCQMDLERTLARFEAFRPAKLLFTRLDETDSLASIFCGSIASGLPLSFFSTGQEIPEDIKPAAKEKVTVGLVKELRQRLEEVA